MKKLIRYSIYTAITLLISYYGYNRIRYEIIATHDKDELVRICLEKALIEKDIPDFDLLRSYPTIVLSTENITPELVPNLPGINIILLTPDAIQEKADAEGDFTYLRFTSFEIQRDGVLVNLDNIWAVGKDSMYAYLSG